MNDDVYAGITCALSLATSFRKRERLDLNVLPAIFGIIGRKDPWYKAVYGMHTKT